ncbi:MAG: glycoside hydrolase family 127 protein [Lachnospiraceae bacterium]|nr:glycoside hydrolase family 127 protein [Lachnospiraceae bacterium]
MKDFSLREVQITSGPFASAKKADVSFMKKIDSDRLLSGFRRSAGLPDKGKAPYGGWEDSRIGGHTMGHYLTAAAQLVSSEPEPEMKERLDYIVEELHKCQKAHGNGFLFGARLAEGEYPERQFDIEEGKLHVEGEMVTWVPWYTLHKILDGLLSVHRLCGNDKALETACGLGDWVCDRAGSWSQSVREHILTTEYGGMNDCLYQLYHQSGEEKYKEAAALFDDTRLMKEINSEKRDTLRGRHANTTIPKFLGALEQHPEQAEGFWERATERHAYATGGISDMEHFHEDYALDGRRTQCNCEGCCAHNMLKLSHRLFLRRPEEKYASYSERLLHNAILGAIDPANGTTAYFSPMATGYTKTFGEADLNQNKFWCCTGTGMENYTKLQEEIYFQEGDTLFVNQYMDSVVQTGSGRLTQQVSLDAGTVSGSMKVSFRCQGITKLSCRIPRWCDGHWHVEGTRAVDDSALGEEQKGYATFRLTEEETVTLYFDMPIKTEVLPDNPEAVCFTCGPYVLAARLGTERLDEKAGAGIDVIASGVKIVGGQEASPEIVYGESHREILPTEVLTLRTGASREEFLQHVSDYMKPVSGESLHFILTGTDAEEIFGGPLCFVPYYEIVKERYGIYWYVKEGAE